MLFESCFVNRDDCRVAGIWEEWRLVPTIALAPDCSAAFFAASAYWWLREVISSFGGSWHAWPCSTSPFTVIWIKLKLKCFGQSELAPLRESQSESDLLLIKQWFQNKKCPTRITKWFINYSGCQSFRDLSHTKHLTSKCWEIFIWKWWKSKIKIHDISQMELDLPQVQVIRVVERSESMLIMDNISGHLRTIRYNNWCSVIICKMIKNFPRHRVNKLKKKTFLVVPN